ncbi:uncharacterized protein LOC134808713 [Pan troglodytes]|uniref:uncharacterized protein LOC134808713 n=1 Tax=Pan troglodytes TaxID=9598 RepID=UPI0030138DF9
MSISQKEQPGCFMVDLLHAYMMVPWIALVCASPVPDTSCGGAHGEGARRTRVCAVHVWARGGARAVSGQRGSPGRRAARREHGARNWRARLAGGTIIRSRRTRPGPRGYGAVAAAGAGAHPRANHRKELKAAGARVAAGVGAGFSGFACPAAPCQEEEETPRTCDTMARLAAGGWQQRRLQCAGAQTYDMDKYVQTQNHCSILEWKCNGSIIFHVGSTHVTDEETKEHSYLLTRTRFEAELRPVEQKLSALRSLLAQRPFFEVPSPLGAVDLYEYACGDEDLEPL